MRLPRPARGLRMETNVDNPHHPGARPLIEVARTWAAIENEETEVDPRELARWFASWRNDVEMSDVDDETPLARLLSEAFSVDGKGHPADFVDWFIDWRRRILNELAACGFGSAIAGLPLSVGLATLLFYFEDDLPEDRRIEAEEAVEAMENGDYVAAIAEEAVAVLHRLLRAVEEVRPAPDLIGKVYRDMAIEAAKARLDEYGRFIAA